MRDTPKVGDRVRVTCEGVVGSVPPGCLEFKDGPVVALSGLQVEILERADDPARDPVGTVRENTGGFGGVYVKTAVQHGEVPWIHVECGFRTGHSETVGRIVGAVPGTPAAEAAEKPAESEYYRNQLNSLTYRVQDERVDFWKGRVEGWRRSGSFQGPDHARTAAVMIRVPKPSYVD